MGEIQKHRKVNIMEYSKKFTDWVTKIGTKILRDDVSFREFDNKNPKSKKRRRGFVVIDEKTGKIAKSFCNPSDQFFTEIGWAIAYARLRGIEIPPLEKSLTIKECVGKVVTINRTEFYVSPISQGCIKNERYLPIKFLCIRIVKPYIMTNFSCFPINADTEVDSYREITVKSVY